MSVHTVVRMHLYKYEILAIFIIHLPFSAFSIGNKQQCKERNGFEAQKKALCVQVTRSPSELRNQLMSYRGFQNSNLNMQIGPSFLPVF